jgi:hypothetical protein
MGSSRLSRFRSSLTSRVRLFLTEDANKTRSWLATVPPGAHTIRVPVEVAGDTLYGSGERLTLAAQAVRGTVIGDHPRWTVRSRWPAVPRRLPPRSGFRHGRQPDPPGQRAALGYAVRDRFDGDSRRGVVVHHEPALTSTRRGSPSPAASRPLSETNLPLGVAVPPGELTADLTIPTSPTARTSRTRWCG